MHLHRLPGPRLLDLSRILAEHDLFVLRVPPRSTAHAGEGGGDAVIVVLRPAFERVVMALRALNANAQKELGRRLGGVLWIAAGPPIVCGRILENAPLR